MVLIYARMQPHKYHVIVIVDMLHLISSIFLFGHAFFACVLPPLWTACIARASAILSLSLLSCFYSQNYNK